MGTGPIFECYQKDHRAGVGSMREKNDHTKTSCVEPQRDKTDLSLSISGKPAPIDIAAFGKRLARLSPKLYAPRASVRSPQIGKSDKAISPRDKATFGFA
jgi:hypothetical protein